MAKDRSPHVKNLIEKTVASGLIYLNSHANDFLAPDIRAEEMRRYALFGTQAAGKVDELKAFTERCLGEYDLQGWTVSDLINPGPTSVVVPK